MKPQDARPAKITSVNKLDLRSKTYKQKIRIIELDRSDNRQKFIRSLSINITKIVTNFISSDLINDYNILLLFILCLQFHL